MKRTLSLFALLLAALALVLPAGGSLSAQDYPPRPDGPILDQSDIIPAAEEAALDKKLRDYNAATGRAIVIAVVDSLQGETPDNYARNLAETWGVGGAETEEGVLLLIAPNDREMWITTARGVQDRLTDISSGRIYRNTLRPAFRQGDFAGGIDRAVDEMIARLDLSPADAKAIAEAEAAAERDRSTSGGFPIGTLIWLGFLFFFFILPIIRRGRRYRAKGDGPWGKRKGKKGRRGRDWGDTATDIILWEVGSAIARGALSGGRSSGGWGGGGSSGGFGGFGGGGGGFNGGGAGGGW